MNSDKHILDGKKPLTCFDVEQAKEFVGKECYFSNHLDKFCTLDDAINYINAEMIVSKDKRIFKGELLGVDDSELCSEARFEAGIRGEAEWFQFCLPCEWVEENEPKYRPYTKDEFLNKFECGKPIIIRHKDDHINVFIETLSSVRIDNFMDEVHVRLYEGIVDLQKLFDEYEWQKSNGDWQSFGIKVKE